MRRFLTVIAALLLTGNISIAAQDGDSLVRDTLRASVKTAHGSLSSWSGERTIRPEAASLLVTPMGEGSIVHFAQTLPGVTSGVEGSSSLYVRGGSISGNVISLDGVRLYGHSHLMGFMSSYSPEIIQFADFTAGGFSAEDMNLTSSHIRMTTKNADYNEHSASVSISNMIVGAHVSLPLVNDRLSLLASVRISPVQGEYLAFRRKIRAGSAIDDLSLFAGDAYAKLAYKVSEVSALSVSYFWTDDRYGIGLKDASEYRLRWSESITAIQWIKNGNSWTQEAVLSINQFATRQLQGNQFQENGDQLAVGNIIREWQGKYVLTLRSPGPFFFKMGMAGTQNQTQAGSTLSTGESEYLPKRRFFDNAVGSFKSLLGALFVEGGFSKESWLDMRLTGRLNSYGSRSPASSYRSNNGEYSVRTRVSPMKSISLVMTADHLVQYHHTLEGLPLGWPLDLMVPATSRMPREITDQQYVGCEFQGEGLDFSLGAFHKKMGSLVHLKGATSLFSPSLGNWERETLVGEGVSRGIESTLEKPAGRINGRLSYTWSKAERTFPLLNGGHSFPASFDRTHVFHLGLTAEIFENNGKRFILETYGTYQSGNYVTLPSGEYQEHTIEGTPVVINYSSLSVNNVRLPSYFRWDAGLRFERKCGKREEYLSLGVYNLTNRHNPFMITYDDAENRWMQVSLFPIMPSINYWLSF